MEGFQTAGKAIPEIANDSMEDGEIAYGYQNNSSYKGVGITTTPPGLASATLTVVQALFAGKGGAARAADLLACWSIDRNRRFMQMSDLRLAEPLLRAVALEGYVTATPIQGLAIPHVLAGRDVLGCAQTGTGKTAAFAPPILHRLFAATTRRGRGAAGLSAAGTRGAPSALLILSASLHQHAGPRAALGMLCILAALAIHGSRSPDT